MYTFALQQDLDTLSLTGSAINDLEMQLTKVKVQYKRTVNEAHKKLEYLRKRLGNNIKKSEPFVEIWRKARQVSSCGKMIFYQRQAVSELTLKLM